MAYNSYGAYSPYFQSQPTDPNDRAQYPYQNPSGDSSGGYQRHNYPNAASSNQQQGQDSSPNQPNYPQNPYVPHTSFPNSRRDYGNSSSARTSGDTSALGNLAYASTLRQNPGDPIQRVADFNKQHAIYDQAKEQGQDQGIQRSDRQGGTNGMHPQNVSTQSHPSYPAYTHPNQYNPYGAGGYGASYQNPAYPHSQPARPDTNATRRTSQAAPPSRPASGQSSHVANQHRQTTHSPRPNNPTSTEQPPSTYRAADTVPGVQVMRPSNAQVHARVDSNSNSRGVDQTHRGNTASSVVHHRETAPPVTQQPSSRLQSTQLPSIANVRNTQNTSPVNANQNPTTVDPNQIFNHYEYQKRQAAVTAEAEAAKKKAAEAEEERKRTEAAKQIQQISQAYGLNGMNDEEARKKEEMEAEMKLMLEKMREYKSKDPTLFSQIWESVKKAQPPGSSKDVAQASAELPASKEVALPSPASHVATNNPQSPNLPPVASNASQAQPGDEQLPDRGKFPAARRGRPGRNSRGGRTSLPGHSTSNGLPVSNSEINTQRQRVHTPSAQLVIDDNAPNSPTNSTLKLPAQRVWVSGKQARTPPQTQTNLQAPVAAMAPSSSDAPSSQTSKPPSAAVESAQPPPHPSGQTLWPEKDKWTLAVAARDTLLSNPVNAGKTIAPEEIHRILNQGPSYEELCRILEAKRFVVDRTPFAQRLLSAVPRLQDGPQTQTQSGTTIPSAPYYSVSRPSATTMASAPPPSSGPRPQYPTPPNVAPTAPMLGVLKPAPVVHSRNLQVTQHPVPKKARNIHRKDPQTNGAAPPPSQIYSKLPASGINGDSAPAMQQPAGTTPQQSLSKQQQARKRSFGEIVDLTAEDEEDAELERQRAEQLKKIQHMQQVKAAMDAAMAKQSTELPPLTHKPKGIRLSPGVGLSSSAASDDDTAGLSRFKNTTPQKERLRKSKNIVQPVKRANAARRSAYSFKTIARDILIATGRHPTMSALNHHLDPLRDHFRYVDYSSDLSTFDWNAVDPGGPPIKPRYMEESEVQGEDNDNDKEDADQQTASAVQPIQRRKDRLAATGNNEGNNDPIVLDVVPTGPIKGFFSSPISIGGRGRGRGRGSRPTRGGMHSSASAATGSPGQHDSQQALESATKSNPTRDVSMLGAGITAPSAFTSKSGPSTPLQGGSSSREAPPSTGTSGKRKRGRPPKNSTPATVPHSSTPESIPNRPGAPPRSSTPQASSATFQASAMPEPRIVGSTNQRTTTPARPSGLRNQIPITSPFAVVIPARSPDPIESSPPSQARKSKKVKRSPPPKQPKYQIYKCRWAYCKAELHNLKTLRKHARMHMSEPSTSADGDGGGDLKCLWADCGVTKIASSSADTSDRQPLTFKSEVAWERHMDGRHLDRYAWELGDGPSTHASGTTPFLPLPLYIPPSTPL